MGLTGVKGFSFKNPGDISTGYFCPCKQDILDSFNRMSIVNSLITFCLIIDTFCAEFARTTFNIDIKACKSQIKPDILHQIRCKV